MFIYSILTIIGKVKILQWMYDNNCLWDEMLCTEAARGGKVDFHVLCRV